METQKQIEEIQKKIKELKAESFAAKLGMFKRNNKSIELANNIYNA